MRIDKNRKVTKKPTNWLGVVAGIWLLFLLPVIIYAAIINDPYIILFYSVPVLCIPAVIMFIVFPVSLIIDAYRGNY